MEIANAPEETFFQTSSTTQTQIDSWIAGKAFDLWNQAPEFDHEELSQIINLRAQQMITIESKHQERFLHQFGFHDASIIVLKQLIEASLQSGRFYDAELYLTRLIKHKNPQFAAQGLSGMVNLCLSFNLNQDAAYYLDRLAQFNHRLIIAENQTIQQFLDQKQQLIQLNDSKKEQTSWKPHKLKLIVGRSNRNSLSANTL